MAGPKRPAEREVDAKDLHVRFSPAVEDAFRAIVVAAKDSKHFDAGMYEILKDWSAGKATTIHTIMVALPSIAGEVAAHVRATGDTTVNAAWDDLCLQLPENGFTITKSPNRER
jgi:hypothetical protein